MYYLELIHRFWGFNQGIHLRPTAIAMYLYLLKTSYDNERYDFNISDIVISEDLGLTRPTIISTKEKLRSLGLIHYQTKNGFACYYRLILDYPLISVSKKVKKEVVNKEQFAQKAEEIATHPRVVDSIQNLTKNTDQEIEVKSIPFQSAKEKRNNEDIPTMEEFINYAQTLDSYEVKMDFSIKEKYETWANNNWKNSSDRQITNWKSSLKSTLPFMKNNIKDKSISLQSIPNIKRPKSSTDKY
ncbi:hypothetical protein EG346_02340 [Chryseobacterium carnipullorum]|uniref:Helix-turn-helix domain-containing protein n=2 Tax=Chryseobacterium carnipullorum TaxID=1124835 RepID=A0A3G6M139_CHRCU|nr:hypothetical protein [Chryseobacterium carnipullorum]AZA47105.1 hypothetical protein EG346_02340 [Chryseobacterium carnipullorum]